MGLRSFELVTLAEATDATFANRPFRGSRRPKSSTPRPWRGTPAGRTQWESSLAAYASPALYDRSVGAIASADVMKTLTPIWSATRETASHVRQRISVVMRCGVAHGYHADVPDGPALLQALPRGAGV